MRQPLDLTSKTSLYLDLVKTQQSSDGFIGWKECDSLLFTSLGVCGGMKANLWAAYDGRRWHRRPLVLPLCCPDSSKSSISRDMLLGLLVGAYGLSDLAMAKSVVAQMRQGIMGDYVGIDGFSRVIPTPGLYATARLLVDKLSGKPLSLWRLVPAVQSKPQGGYIDHLTGLHLALRCLIVGKKTAKDKKVAQKLYESNPLNPLFVVLHKDYDTAKYCLSVDTWWPSDRLPTSADRKTGWIPERDSKDYAPDPDSDHIHSGMDLAFLVWLLGEWTKLN